MSDETADESAPATLSSTRLLDALEKSTRVTTEVIGHIKGLERRIEGLEKESQTMNAHLDNMVRQQEITNSLLEDGNVIRQAELSRSELKDREERDWRRGLIERGLDREDTREDRGNQLVDDNRASVKSMATEAWVILKQPLGYLIAGVIAWVLYHNFGVPLGATTPTVQEDGTTHAPARHEP
jgi:hypothetical protein